MTPSDTFPHLHVVILCGEADARLWPLSRAHSAQELYIPDGQRDSLLSATVRRVKGFSSVPLTIITNSALSDQVAAHLIGQSVLKPDDFEIVSEPYPRGSAFTIALAAAHLKRMDPSAIMMVLPARQSFEIDDRWPATIARAYRVAAEDKIAVLGTTPTHISANHGFIKPGANLKGVIGARHVRTYLSQPSPSLTYRMSAQGGLWSTDILMMRATVALAELRHVAAQSDSIAAQGSQRIAETAGFLVALGDEHWFKDEAREVIATLPAVSYEQAVLENTDNLVVVPTTLEWTDISSLSALDESLAGDRAGNRLWGRAALVDTQNTTFYGGDKKLVVALGTRNLMVIDTPDAMLIAAKDSLDAMADVTVALRDMEAPELLDSATTAYAWGTATLLQEFERCRIKRIEIAAHQKTPLESQSTINEQWTVAEGRVTVIRDGETQGLSAGQSVTIPPKTPCALHNNTAHAVTVIAVQSSKNFAANKTITY